MVATNSAVNRIGVEGGGEIKNRRGKIFVVRSCHITTRIFEVLQESLPARFFRKKIKLAGTLGGPLTVGNLRGGSFLSRPNPHG